jgi:ribonuclease R
LNKADEILNILDQSDGYMFQDEMLSRLPSDERGTYASVLDELIQSGRVMTTKRGKLVNAERLGYYTGKLEVKPGGYAFLRREEEDIFIPPGKKGSALNGDTVQVKLVNSLHPGRSKEGVVEKIVEPARQTIVGVLDKGKHSTFVVPDDRRYNDVFIPKMQAAKAKDGQKVVAEITTRSVHGRSAEGVIKEVLGYPGDVGIDILSIARSYGLPDAFDKAALEEARNRNVPVSDKDLAGREDFTADTVFTIDGDDAKDLDDAVSLKMDADGSYELGVHIADVGHYVREGSELDREAFKRGTSVYLLDRVIPMLPKELSNGICSLNPREKRLTLSCIMHIDKGGNVLSHRISESVIFSRQRMTYRNVNKMLAGDTDALEKYADIQNDVLLMAELAKILREKREQKGSIDLDIDEAKIELDPKGKPVKIYVRERGDAEKLIEEFMLIANKTVATEYFYRETPFVYRVHGQPDADKMRLFAAFVTNFGFKLKGSAAEIHPKELQRILNESKGEKHENIVNRVMLRSMRKAEYSGENKGHFGLGFDCYCHFTSPIRRYPDLAIHRIIKESLHGKLNEKETERLASKVPDISLRSSERERLAMEAERAVEDIKKAEYMVEKLGETYTAVISGVTPNALFAELDNTVEGVIPLAGMDDDYYVYYEKMYCVIGEHSKKRYNLGDEVKVLVKSVDTGMPRVEFSLV